MVVPPHAGAADHTNQVTMIFYSDFSPDLWVVLCCFGIESLWPYPPSHSPDTPHPHVKNISEKHKAEWNFSYFIYGWFYSGSQDPSLNELCTSLKCLENIRMPRNIH